VKSKLPVGKINPDILAGLIARYTGADNRILIGPGIGEDATIIDMGRSLLVAKTDPITHVTGEIGRYAVNVNANDIAAMGGTPLWFLATLLMPVGSDLGSVESVFCGISEACKELGVSYCGGHTEVTSSVNVPVVVGQMLGEVTKERLKPSSAAQVNDHIIMTKRAAIEGTAMIALEKGEEIQGRIPEALLSKALNYLHDPGISVVKEGRIASGFPEVHALHDPTEGGVATGIFEMATASNLGVQVYLDEIPISQETLALCRHFGVDPLGVFASGSLLISVAPTASENLRASLERQGIPCSHIGRMLSKESGMTLIKGGAKLSLPVYHQDELSKIFG
jgi:hydrogenase expression/formation protein HypE